MSKINKEVSVGEEASKVVTNQVITEQAQEAINAADEVISEKLADKNADGKFKVEYLEVPGFKVVEGEPAFVQTLGPLDTVTSLSIPAGFTGIVTAVSKNGFETETTTYVKVK